MENYVFTLETKGKSQDEKINILKNQMKNLVTLIE
jgi:hypothetical protein